MKFSGLIIFMWLISASAFITTDCSAEGRLSNILGEKINYDIKKLGIKVGEATLRFAGAVEDNASLIVFRASSFNFYDEEKIYVDSETLFPKKVVRDLNIFGKKERITEYYDSEKGTIRVVKSKGDVDTEQIIKKEGKLDNIYCFIYRYRQGGKFKIGDELDINLPTKDVKVQLVKTMNLDTPAGKFDVFYMQSVPSKYKVWFDNSRDRIPLRIDGSVGLSSTSMVMTSREYTKD